MQLYILDRYLFSFPHAYGLNFLVCIYVIFGPRRFPKAHVL